MRILAGAAALTAGAAAAGVLSGCGNVDVGRHDETRSYTAPSGARALKVHTGQGGVEIVASDSPGIRVQERLRWSNRHNRPHPKHAVEGTTLSLTASCSANIFGTSVCGVSYRVEVPRATPVEVHTGDGRVTANGLSGSVALSSRDGSITALDLRARSLTVRSGDGSVRVSGRAATADLRSRAGSVTASALDSDGLTARTGDGRITVSGRAATARLRTGAGSITATGLAADRLTARSDDGRVVLGFTAPPADVEAGTRTGSIRVAVPAGEGYAISLSTTTGAKRIDRRVHQDSGSHRRIKATTDDAGITIVPS